MPTPTNPLNDPDFISAVTSPEFAALPWEKRRAKLAENVPEFAASSAPDQNNILGMIQKKSNMLNSPQAKYQKIVDLTADMVRSGEMSAAEEREALAALAAKGYGPGLPAPPAPPALQSDAQQQAAYAQSVQRAAAANPFALSALNPPLNSIVRPGLDRLANAPLVASRPGLDNKLQAASDVVRGAGQVAAPLALPLAALAGPVALGIGLLGGYAGSQLLGAGARALGAGPGMQNLAEDVGGFAGGAGLDAAASKLSPSAGALLQDAAQAQYSRVLNATTKANKATSARIVPQLLDRGVSAGSAKGLLSHFQGQRDAAGQALDDAWGNIPAGTTVPLNPVLDAMDRHASDSFLSPSGKPLSAEAAKGIGIVQDLGQRLADESTADPQSGEPVVAADTLRRYRQEWDRITNKANGFTSTLDDTTSGGAHSIGGDAARASINGQFPDIDAANKEYGLWSDASRVMGDTMQRRQGQAPPLGAQIAKVAGAAAGYGVGGVHGGLLGGAAADGLSTVGASVPWSTNMARLKYGVGGLLQQAPTPQVPYWVPGLLSTTANVMR